MTADDIGRLESQYDWLKELVGEGAEFESVQRELFSRDAQIENLEREASGQLSRIQKLQEQVHVLEERLGNSQAALIQKNKDRDHAALLASVRLGLYLSAKKRLHDARDLNAHRDWLISEQNAEINMLRERITNTPGGAEFLQALITSMS